MKNSIIERLLDQGHITIRIADRILNNKPNKTEIISNLKYDGVISTHEAVILLKDKEGGSIPVGAPNQTFPTTTLTYPPSYPDWTYDPNRPGTPRWDVTCSSEDFTYTTDLNKNFTDK